MSNGFAESAVALSRQFYARDPLDVAPALLNKVLRYGTMSGRIVEVEAYRGSEDPASHAFRGQTKRNATMFGEPGHLYTYFTYGMHWCANVVCGEAGVASAVLIRALAPLAGLESMRERRAVASHDTDLCSGPAKLCQAFGLGSEHDGADLITGPVRILDDSMLAPSAPVQSTRIGLTKGVELQWRFHVAGDPNVSHQQQ